MTRQFANFIVVGGIAAGVNWGANLALLHIIALELSVVVAYLLGMTTAYLLNRFYVFEHSGRRVSDEYLRFAVVNVVALVQVWCVTVGLANYVLPALNWSFHPKAVAHAIGVASPIITSYLGHRHFTFAIKPSKKGVK